jgi:hypothetical protein
MTGDSTTGDMGLAPLVPAPSLENSVISDLLTRSLQNTESLGRTFIPQRMPEGVPTLGRHSVSLSDVHRSYVSAPIFRDNGRRELIWNNFLCLTARVRKAVPVNAVMIGGSFTTWKQAPGDIDVVFVLDKRHSARLSDQNDRNFITALSSGESARIRSWGIDSYTLDWEAIPRTAKDNPAHRDYLLSRGYWDDWLQRSHSKSEEPNVGHAVPRRGYLEVIIDGYAADV